MSDGQIDDSEIGISDEECEDLHRGGRAGQIWAENSHLADQKRITDFREYLARWNNDLGEVMSYNCPEEIIAKIIRGAERDEDDLDREPEPLESHEIREIWDEIRKTLLDALEDDEERDYYIEKGALSPAYGAGFVAGVAQTDLSQW